MTKIRIKILKVWKGINGDAYHQVEKIQDIPTLHPVSADDRATVALIAADRPDRRMAHPQPITINADYRRRLNRLIRLCGPIRQKRIT